MIGRKLAAPLRRFGLDRSGVAMIEFAIGMPLVIFASLAGAEMTNYITVRTRVSQLALHIADNAARIGSGSQLAAKTITETDINDLLTGAGLQSGEINLYGNGRVILSSLEPMANPNTAGTYKITWQRCRGLKAHSSTYGNVGDTNLTGMGPSGRQAFAPDDGATMYVEIYYEYQPLISANLAPSTTIVDVASMVVRDRRDLSQIYNAEGATASTCDRYTTA